MEKLSLRLFHKKRRSLMAKKENKEITIRSSAAEYLIYIASVGEDETGIEIR